MSSEQLTRMRDGQGFIAALDQSGGSTPKTLDHYGVPSSAYSNDDAMFDLIHAMRVRIMSNSSFTSSRILGAILFEGTMLRDVEGLRSSQYLWREKGILPFLKIDLGLSDEEDGVQVMKPIHSLEERLETAKSLDVFGTKMRSVIKSASPTGIEAVVEQQFELARRIVSKGLVPIVEPEVDIKAIDKRECENLLRDALRDGLNTLNEGSQIVFKLTLPEDANFYEEFTSHPRVLRLAALSGGYSREDANRRLAANHAMIASFSRALTENLRVDLTDEAFSVELDEAISTIAQASAS